MNPQAILQSKITLALVSFGLGFSVYFMMPTKQLTQVVNSPRFQELEKANAVLEHDAKLAWQSVQVHQEALEMAHADLDTLKGKLSLSEEARRKFVAEHPVEVGGTSVGTYETVTEAVVQDQHGVIVKQDEIIATLTNDREVLKGIVLNQDQEIDNLKCEITMFIKKDSELPAMLKKERWKGRAEGVLISPLAWLCGKIF